MNQNQIKDATMSINITDSIYRLFIVCISFFITIGMCPYCHAEMTSTEKSIKCNESLKNMHRQNYEESSDTQYILTTKGIRVSGINDLVTNWSKFVNEATLPPQPNYVQVDAACIQPGGGRYSYHAEMWPLGKTLICKKGWGLSISMFSPRDQDPDKYNYVAMLTIYKDEGKKEEIEGNKTTYLGEKGLSSSELISLFTDMLSSKQLKGVR
ncbi:MAG: hypothetical protein ACD_69C00362G0001 [uncultured bacterium]|nr:MAG: hypothetical protein ACD_69C00362G0001 [uncultured bacterium]HBY55401.1 hypothetical protein [Coxiellaceae bacterium]